MRLASSGLPVLSSLFKEKNMKSSLLPFFILGHPRSGTTATAHLLNASSQVACLYYEGNILYRLWIAMQRCQVLSEPWDDLLADCEVTIRHNLQLRAAQTDSLKIQFSDWAVTELLRCFQLGLENYNTADKIYESFSKKFFTIFAADSKKNVVGEKVPDFINIPQEVTSPHAECRVIHIHREPRAVIHSSLIFNKTNFHLFAVPDAFAMAISYCLKQLGLESFLANFSPERSLSFNHAELLDSPTKVAEKLASFLNLRDDFPVTIRALYQKKKVKDWRREMALSDQQAVVAVCHHFLKSGERTAEIRGDSSWQDKAAILLPLLSCENVEIVETISMALSFFSRENDRRSLGLTLMQFADYAHRRSQYERARIFYSQAADLLPGNPSLYYRQGELHFDMKRLTDALFFLEELEKICPKTVYYSFLRAKGFCLRGRIYRIEGESAKAASCYRNALIVKPDYCLPGKLLTNI